MGSEKLFEPISQELAEFECLIDGFIEEVENKKIRENYKAFFKARGKYLRPALLLFSAGAVKKDRSSFNSNLYKLGLILELLHSASLIHDDIVDEDYERRGEKSVNQIFGNKVAVLAGDTLFSYAFRETARLFDNSYVLPITDLALNMCMAELEQANKVDSVESYFRVIQGKTAHFMAVACEFGARFAGGSDEEIEKFHNIGLNIGLTYQMIDDFIDEDPNALQYITQDMVDIYYNKAMKSLNSLDESEFQQGLIQLLVFMKNMK